MCPRKSILTTCHHARPLAWILDQHRLTEWSQSSVILSLFCFIWTFRRSIPSTEFLSLVAWANDSRHLKLLVGVFFFAFGLIICLMELKI